MEQDKLNPDRHKGLKEKEAKHEQHTLFSSSETAEIQRKIIIVADKTHAGSDLEVREKLISIQDKCILCLDGVESIKEKLSGNVGIEHSSTEIFICITGLIPSITAIIYDYPDASENEINELNENFSKRINLIANHAEKASDLLYATKYSQQFSKDCSFLLEQFNSKMNYYYERYTSHEKLPSNIVCPLFSKFRSDLQTPINTFLAGLMNDAWLNRLTKGEIWQHFDREVFSKLIRG